jgi:preprotein translocase subunit YajC
MADSQKKPPDRAPSDYPPAAIRYPLLCIMRRSHRLTLRHGKGFIMDWLISTAAAQATGGSGQSGALMQIPFLILMFVVFYFLLIRPQTKRAKEHRAMVAALEVGAEVVTNGGILGKVTQLGEQYLTLEIADGVHVKVQRATVAQILPKGTLKSV